MLFQEGPNKMDGIFVCNFPISYSAHKTLLTASIDLLGINVAPKGGRTKLYVIAYRPEKNINSEETVDEFPELISQAS